MYAGGRDTEGVQDGPDSEILQRNGDHITRPSTEHVGKGFRCKDQEKSRR